MTPRRSRLARSIPVLGAALVCTLTLAPAVKAGRTHEPIAVFAAGQSTNWFGYNQGILEKGTPFQSITGDWTVPAASSHNGTTDYSATWIGIGGGCLDTACDATDATLIQTGTEQDASPGSSSYSAWWEVIPAPSLTITSMTVGAGDHMHASISQLAPEVWSITLQDVSRVETFSQIVPYTSTLATAEWIEETPLLIGSSPGTSTLPNLTTTPFDLATVNGANAQLSPSEEIQLVDGNGNVIGTPSSPDPDTDGFNVCAWATSCAAPGSS